MLLLASRLRTGPGLLAAAALLVASSADAAATVPLQDVDPKPIEVSGTLDAAGLADLRVRLAVRPRRPPRTVGADDWLSGPTVRWSAPVQVDSAGRFTVAQPWPRDRHASPRAVVVAEMPAGARTAERGSEAGWILVAVGDDLFPASGQPLPPQHLVARPPWPVHAAIRGAEEHGSDSTALRWGVEYAGPGSWLNAQGDGSELARTVWVSAALPARAFRVWVDLDPAIPGRTIWAEQEVSGETRLEVRLDQAGFVVLRVPDAHSPANARGAEFTVDGALIRRTHDPRAGRTVLRRHFVLPGDVAPDPHAAQAPLLDSPSAWQSGQARVDGDDLLLPLGWVIGGGWRLDVQRADGSAWNCTDALVPPRDVTLLTAERVPPPREVLVRLPARRSWEAPTEGLVLLDRDARPLTPRDPVMIQLAAPGSQQRVRLPAATRAVWVAWYPDERVGAHVVPDQELALLVGTVDAGENLCALTQHATAVTVPAPPADAGGGVQTLETRPPDPQAVHVDSTHLRIPQSRVVRGLPPGEYWVVQRRPLADGGTQLGWWTSFEVEAPAR